MDGGAWWAAVHGVTESRTRLSDFTFTFHFYALEKEMATHSSVLAWRIPGTGEPGGLPDVYGVAQSRTRLKQLSSSSSSSSRVSLEGRRRRGQQKMRWLDGITNSVDMKLGQSLRNTEGQGGLVCCCPWGCKESDTIWGLNNNNRPSLVIQGWRIHPATGDTGSIPSPGRSHMTQSS